jgi:hypothetical protein
MSENRDLFEKAINEAYERQVEDRAASSDVRHHIVSAGRRRRASRALGWIVLVGVVVLGASTVIDGFRNTTRPAPADAPAIGAEKVVDFGGPLAANAEALYVANGRKSNDAGDKQSIARFDFASRKVTETDPTSMAPHSVSLGSNGLWMVGWHGDLPLNGDPDRAKGQIQLVDPDSSEVSIDIPRDGFAPSDVAAGELNGNPVAWVVDAGGHELLKVDGESGAVETVESIQSPNHVIYDGGRVWVTSNHESKGTLTRYDPLSGQMDWFSVGHCMNDLVLHDGSVWVLDYCGRAIHSFDVETFEKQASVSLGAHPSALTVSDGLIWVQRENDVVRVDPEREEVVGDPIVAGQEASFFDAYMETAEDGVYVSSFEGVYRLAEGLPIQEPGPTPTPEPEDTRDPLAYESCDQDGVTCIPLDREWSVAGAGFGSAWVANIGEGDTFGIARFDAATGEETARLGTEGFVRGFAPDDRWMWALLAASTEFRLLQIDPETTTVVNTYDLGDIGTVGTASIAAGDGYVWVSQPKGDVARLSVDTGEITVTAYGSDLPGFGASNGPLNLAYGEDRLWLSWGKGHLGVVDPGSGELVRVDEDALGVNAYQIVVAQGAVWSPHQDVQGDNVITYAPTSGSEEGRGRVVLETAVPGLAATDGTSVWVVQDPFNEKDTGWLIQIDASSHERVGEPLEIETGFQGGVAVGDGYVWVTGNRVLYRVDTNG